MEIDEHEGSALMDFTGTGCEVRGNLNTPQSVVHSAIIYSMRAMLDSDIPLNAGCLAPLNSRSIPQQNVSAPISLQSKYPKVPSSRHLERLLSVEETS